MAAFSSGHMNHLKTVRRPKGSLVMMGTQPGVSGSTSSKKAMSLFLFLLCFRLFRGDDGAPAPSV